MRRDREPRSIRSKLIFILSIGLVLVVLYTFFAPSFGDGSALLPQPTSTFRPGPTVIQAIQREANLETVVMNISGDMTINREHGFLGACSESLTYLGYFNVSAGIDLGEISSANIQATNDGNPDQASVVVTLPAPEILHNELDTTSSRIVAEDTTKWVPGCSHQIADMTVEAQAKLREYAAAAAREQGILRKAETYAGEELQRLLETAGYTNVSIRYASDTTATPVPTAKP